MDTTTIRCDLDNAGFAGVTPVVDV